MNAHMSITEEDGGRLNAFAKEPKIEVIEKQSSDNRGSWVIIIAGVILFGGLIVFTITIS